MSRLERLLTLIDTGTSEAVRKVAAAQIGDIQASHPEELHNLLDAVGKLLLYSKSWETRTAAAAALDSILSNTPTWNPEPAIKKEENEEDGGGAKDADAYAEDSPLKKFDLKDVIKWEALTGTGNPSTENESNGAEERDIDKMIESETDKAFGLQKEKGKRKIKNEGSDSAEPPLKSVKIEQNTYNEGVTVKMEPVTYNEVKTEDNRYSEVKMEPATFNEVKMEQNAHNEETTVEISSRMKAMQKIREKDAKKAPSVSLSKGQEDAGSAPPGQTKLVSTEQPQDSTRIVLETVRDDSKGPSADLSASTTWPLEHFGRTLLREAASRLWTVRHGAALGLRALLQERYVAGAGKTAEMTPSQMRAANVRWVEGAAARLLEVLVRDRFSDFSSAQTVAPVRETCAQALGVLARSFGTGTAERLLDILEEMGTQDEWIVRYSALLGIKYVVAVRQDLAEVIVPRVFETVIMGSQDNDDDVRAVAAATLVPVADEIISKRLVEADRLIALERLLWKTLGELDEITAATASVLELLSVLYANKESPLFTTASKEKFEPYISILLPYINHSLENVRRSALSMIKKLAELPQFDEWFGDHIFQLTNSIYFSIVVDEQMEAPLTELWRSLIIHSNRVVLGSLQQLGNWINALRVPGILDLRNGSEIGKGAKLAACLSQNPDDAGTSKLLARDTGAAGFLLGCQAIAMMCAAYPPRMLAMALDLLRQVFECPNPAAPSQVTALIASTVIESIGSIAPRATTRAELPPQVLALMGAFMQKRVPVPAGEYNLQLRTAAACAMCFTYWKPPEHLSEVINVMMTLLKNDTHREFQEHAAAGLAMMAAKTLGRKPSPVPKMARIISATLAAPLLGECTIRKKLERRGGVKALGRIARIMKDALFDRVPKLWRLMSEPLLPDPQQQQEQETTDTAQMRTIKEGDPRYSPVIVALCLYSVLLPCVHPSLKPKFLDLLTKIIELIPSTDDVIREEAIKSTVAAAKENVGASMVAVIEHLLPFLRPTASDEEKIASCKALCRLVADLDDKFVPYTSFFVGPLLSCMSDQRRDVRESAAYGFGTVIKLLPLEEAMTQTKTPAEIGLPQYLVERRDSERAFLQQLLDGRRLEHYPLPFAIRGTLRKYQQEGINWLAFLRKYHLHGILCDDMGLGKTLQAICAMAASALDPADELAQTRPSIVVCPSTLVGHWANEIPKFIGPEYLRAVPYTAKTRAGREAIVRGIGARQIVVVSYEALRNDISLFEGIRFNYCILDEGHLIKNPRSKTTRAVKSISASCRLILSGTPIQNNVLELWSLFDFLIPGFLGTEQEFNDRFSKPILQSRNPNCAPKDHEAGILALEALHKQVQPLLLRRLKTDVLHDLPPKIVQDYVVELTPVQVELYEDFSRHQREGTVENLYAGGEDDEDGDGGSGSGSGSGSAGTLRALQYLIKACDHPAMVLTPSHPKYADIIREYGGSREAVNDYTNSAKLVALRDLLVQCGIEGAGQQQQQQQQQQQGGSDGDTEEQCGSRGSHRVLVFAQLKGFLDIIEEELFRKAMRGVSYLRMDGTTPVGQRQGIVDKFNGDPTIDVLLLTTKVGGLGLTLTGADTVIFVEHDWNPKNDLQAMDRAHRIGQTKVVNVYRIITKGTIEEKIMGMQRFKNFISDTVISDEETDKANSLLTAKDTSNLLDLFSLSGASAAGAGATRTEGGRSGDIDTIIDKDKEMEIEDAVPVPGLGLGGIKGLGDENDDDDEEKEIEKGYSDQFNMDAFLKKNKKI